MNTKKLTPPTVSAALILLCAIALVPAQEKPAKTGHGHLHRPPEATAAKSMKVPDVEVLTQNGQKQKFYTDLVKDKVVIINFIFTTCKAVCPLMGTNFSKLQSALGERLGRDVFLISVSTDPETDSPARLKAWGEKFKAKDGWTLVTGRKEDLTTLLEVLRGDGPSRDFHSLSVGIIDDQKKLHRRAYGLEAPERVIQMIDELAKAN